VKEYRWIDKTTWPKRGEWDNEPDKVQWIDEATNLDCLAVRTPHSGHWCGYVGVTEKHPCFEKDYNQSYDLIDGGFDVHGGLTFSGHCHESATPERGICHVPESGRPDNVWWLGFDCAHCGDISPAYQRSMGYGPMDRYRTLNYVKNECANLAKQLAGMK